MNVYRPFADNFLRSDHARALSHGTSRFWGRFSDFVLFSQADSPELPAMTVCIGILCMDGKAVVMAADRQVSHPNFKFATISPDRKIVQLSSRQLLATADEPFSESLIEECRRIPTDDLPAEKVASSVYGICAKQWRERMGQTVTLWKHGMDYDKFMEEYRSGRIDESVAQKVELDALRVPANGLFLLAVSDNKGAHLHSIAEKEGSTSIHSPGFGAIGSGADLAYSVLFRKPCARSCSVADAVYLAYEAKKMADNICPTVGKETDLAVILPGQDARFLGDDAIARLETIYNSKEPPSLTKSEIESIQSLLPITKL